MPTWGKLLEELKPEPDENGNLVQKMDVNQLKHKYLERLSNLTGRNVIAYYSGWLKPGKVHNVDINDSDMTGFMNALNGIDCSKGLDLILHTPGGDPTATEGIVKYLRTKFNDIRIIVPQMAMSAGTMLACAGNSIVMGSHSSLGPIDPQFNGVPAYNIIEQFKEAKEDLEKNPKSREYWRIQLEKYQPAFIYRLNDAISLSDTLVKQWLKEYMFAGDDEQEAEEKIKKIVSVLNSNNKSHAKHFMKQYCIDLGLKIESLEDNQDLQEAVLSVHHAFIIIFDLTPATKIIENQIGSCYLTQQGQLVTQRR